MSIKRKLLLSFFTIIIVQMLLQIFGTTFIFEKQASKNKDEYLGVAIQTIRNEMENKVNITKKAANMFGVSPILNYKVKIADKAYLTKSIKSLRDNYEHLDFALFVDATGKVIVASKDVRGLDSKLSEIMKDSLKKHKTIASETILDLKSLFLKDSEYYNKFRIELGDDAKHRSKYFYKALAGIAIVPFYDENTGKPEGAFIIGGIVNNDSYFPTFYSTNVKGSYLAVSIDGVRVASNIKSNVKNNFTGSLAPKGILLSNKDRYYGKVLIDEGYHYFLDEKIKDYQGKGIAVVGIGIPEVIFTEIIATNNKTIIVINLVVLFLVFVFSNYLSERISKPILNLSEATKKFSSKYLGKEVAGEFNTKDEVEIIVKRYQELTKNILMYQANKEEHLRINEETLLVLAKEREKEQGLLDQIKKLNAELEQIVEERTESLRNTVVELENASLAKTKFMANISHDLRTPLNAIIGATDILEENILGDLNERQLKYVKSIKSSGNNLLQLINDILDVSKINAGKMELHVSQFLIGDAIKQVFSSMESSAKAKNIDFTYKIYKGDFLIYADAQKLKQILYNLFSNSIKFTLNGGMVKVKVFKRDDLLEVKVIDNGIGISKENQGRVFKEFEQVDNSYNKEYEGTGLGLALVKKLVEMHGGIVFLKSVEKEGTEVMFTINITEDSYKGGK